MSRLLSQKMRSLSTHPLLSVYQLSKFLRCKSPSTFLGICLSHHSFIIFLVTNTNTLLSGLCLISTFEGPKLRPEYWKRCVNALSGLYLISTYTALDPSHSKYLSVCQCPLGLIPHFYTKQQITENGGT